MFFLVSQCSAIISSFISFPCRNQTTVTLLLKSNYEPSHEHGNEFEGNLATFRALFKEECAIEYILADCSCKYLVFHAFFTNVVNAQWSH